ncbi:AraC family transcriptional regulator [Bariatricus sp. SGI.154]|uniref:AraC family transcriptional regulator n=1 Tax=Bariatricus sp. SGI.154 TaxID=3420549 RepID=UPI003D07BDA2
MKDNENIEKLRGIRDSAYHETKRHTDIMFAFNIYPCTIPKDFTFVPLHWQDSMEVIYVKRGRGRVQVDFMTYEAEEGDIFLILPGHLHGLRSVVRESMEYENIIFDMSFLGSDSVDLCSQRYLQPMIRGKVQIPAHIGKEDVLYSKIAACLDASDHLCAVRSRGYELAVKGQMLLLVSALFQEAPDREEYNIDDRNVQKLKVVISRIEKDYNKKLTVDDMAAECGYSASHFMRWFRKVTGTAFLGYLIEYRLGKAAQALRNGDDTVLEIAEQTGFDNLSNFNRLFKKRFEMTPSQFRKNNG